MNCEATLHLAMPDPATARAAIAPDDDGHVETHVEEGLLAVRAHSGTALGLLRSLDDVLVCLRALGDD